MTGRRTGSLVVVLAMLAVLTGHAFLRPQMAGTAVAITVPGPPRPGDCVLSAPDPSLSITSGLTTDVSVVLGPCVNAVGIVGEIVSVSAGRRSGSDQTIGALMGTSGDCWAAASRYAGLVADDGVARLPTVVSDPGEAIQWHPDLRVRGQRIGADLLQQAVGRGWSACVVRPLTLAAYTGSIRAALRTGLAPAEYGSCSATADLRESSLVPCSRPHSTEQLGWAGLPIGSVAQDRLQQSCRSLAVRLLRTGDPTYAGALRIVTVTHDITTCAAVVTGPGRLVGSLIGLGAGPLPFAG
ncbi:hypothetical protein ABIB25_003996 [Nakamurella sp. UYEF19]|uniref:hypothetical protein n=1 Tax=Nakamurella sp. UYEF19 TaxID=1756392 RepID=UPI0033908171